jgi:hypothetical protein
MLVTNCMAIEPTIIRRDLFAELGGYDENITMASDWELLMRLLKVENVIHLDRYVGMYTIFNDGSNSSIKDAKRTIADMVKTYAKHPVNDRPGLIERRQAVVEHLDEFGVTPKAPLVTF